MVDVQLARAPGCCLAASLLAAAEEVSCLQPTARSSPRALCHLMNSHLEMHEAQLLCCLNFHSWLLVSPRYAS